MLYKNNMKEYLLNIIFCFSSFLLAIRGTLIFSYYKPPFLLSCLQIFIWGGVFVVLLLQSFSVRELLKASFILIIALFVYLNSGSVIPLLLIFFFISSKTINKDSIIQTFLFGNIISVVILIQLYLLGIIDTRIFDGGNSLGFRNPNSLSYHITIIILYWIYLRYNRICFIDFFFLIIISIVFGIVSNCRTGIFLNFGIIFLTFCVKYIKKVRKLYKKVSFPFIILICVLAITGCIFVNFNPLIDKIDRLLSGRFRWAQIYLGLYGITPFGTFFTEKITENLPLDNGYANILITNGIIYFIIFIFIFWKSLRQANRNDNMRLSIILFSVLLGMITETHFIPIAENCVIILCFDSFFGKTKYKRGSGKCIKYLKLFLS